MTCVIMQNNGAMKIVNFTHAQTAETMQAFFPPPMNAGYEASYHRVMNKINVASYIIMVL